MGQARQRGTYEERVAQAISEGRVKPGREQARINHHSLSMTAAGMALLGMARNKLKGHKVKRK